MGQIKPTWQTADGSVQLYLGDCLEILPQLPEGSVDAVVTDPPYSSGGAFRGDRTQGTLEKYVQSGSQVQRNEFTGDNRDQRSFMAWCSLWLCAARRASAAGATLCCFTDWRQLPTMTDAIQSGGWVWRNLATWWKPGVRMQRGRFSLSAEYVVFGSNGPHAADGERSPQNVFSCAPVGGDDKVHIAEKPAAVADWLVGVTRPGSVILDPFVGSGAFALACLRNGRRFVGVEIDTLSLDIAVKRIEAELNRAPLFDEPVPVQRTFTEGGD